MAGSSGVGRPGASPSVTRSALQSCLARVVLAPERFRGGIAPSAPRHAAVVAGLAERGADVDALNDRGQSPLAGAVFKDEQDVVAALLEAGADPEAGTPTARETAAMFGRTL